MWTSQGGGCRIGGAKEVECPCKTKQTVAICRMFLLVDGGTGIGVRLMQA
jgi:hypothetical protein